MTGTWILIVMIHVGVLGNGNSNAITNVPGFENKASCEEAGKKSLELTAGTVKETKFVCVKR